VREDLRGLLHLDHERRVARGEIVRRADAREDAVDDADVRPRGGHEAANLRHQRDQRRLA
jgi:hypothetical protein